jgi:protein-disulfide isomerase
MSNRDHRADLENAANAAARKGVNSTPTFFINNQRLNGNYPYEEFQRIIDAELAKSQ